MKERLWSVLSCNKDGGKWVIHQWNRMPKYNITNNCDISTAWALYCWLFCRGNYGEQGWIYNVVDWTSYRSVVFQEMDMGTECSGIRTLNISNTRICKAFYQLFDRAYQSFWHLLSFSHFDNGWLTCCANVPYYRNLVTFRATINVTQNAVL